MKRGDQPRLPELPAALRGLKDLALNFQWSWDPQAAYLWKSLARLAPLSAEERARLNPVQVLQRLEAKDLEALARDRQFLEQLRRVHRQFLEQTRESPKARKSRIVFTPENPVAYFSMEFGIHPSLPVYAGGLGILAGDHLKSASDIGLPLVGMSLIYRRGYFRQELDRRGRQKVVYPRTDYGQLPIELVRQKNGSELRVTVQLPGGGRKAAPRQVHLRVWRVQVGRSRLFLLDTDFDLNLRRDRALTQRLYGGLREERVAQEVLVGVGGVRALRAMGLQPAVWHLNEGHVAFSTLERLRELIVESDMIGARRLGFSEAVEAVAADTVFTTHTPVPEGNEVFDLRLARRYLEPTCRYANLPVDSYLRLGLDHDPSGKPVLSMTVLALRLSRFRNGVSRLHGQVSRRMWRRLWPGFSEDEVPITSVTNGVHMPTWVAPAMEELFKKHLGADWRARLDQPEFWKRAGRIPDAELWREKSLLRRRLVEFVRERARWNLLYHGATEAEARRATRNLLSPDALTIGFSRRFALYKRAALLFRDLKKARALFSDRKRPVQIVFAGKPHPEDAAGKKLFEQVAAISRKTAFRNKVVVLENYDIGMAQAIVQGADVWLNTPQRPLEACGTSGQKVPPNGGLNASILDGWWAEGYAPEVGFAIGKPIEYADKGLQDEEDARDLHRVLGREVVPLFYQRGRNGQPRRWLAMVKRSMAALIPRFNTDHMVLEYHDRLYLPAVKNGMMIQMQDFQEAKAVAAWKEEVAACWPLVHASRCSARRRKGGRPGLIIGVELFLAGLSVETVQALAFAGESLARPRRIRPAGPGAWRFEFRLPRAARSPVRARFWPDHPALPHFAEAGLSLAVEIG
ncbi:MAG: alpha-glucan family phosphorylase [Planctomycetes bacterium]|nr:alpha-glucan family phosphorylase [Planctomycetota bacterium]